MDLYDGLNSTFGVIGGNDSGAMEHPDDQFFYRIKYLYDPYHGFLSLAVCIFGIIANVANIIVLTRKEMVSATNSILTGLAVADMLVMVDYVPFTLHNYVMVDSLTREELFSYGWAAFALFHAHFSVVCHTISTWLTVLLAVWRYIAVRHPVESKVWCSKERTSYFIAGTYILVVICCIPVYMTFTIIEDTHQDNPNQILYKVGFSSIAQLNGSLLMKINFWVFSVATKLAPCILLTYLSITLIQALIEADNRKERLRRRPEPSHPVAPAQPNSSSAQPTQNTINVTIETDNGSNRTTYKSTVVAAAPTPPPPPHHVHVSRESTQNDRTNRMLIAVLLLFLLTEFPSGILVLLSGILGDTFFSSVYTPLGDVLDILALVNSSINFILYCTMSSIFRTTFIKIFCSCFKHVRDPNAVTMVTNNNCMTESTPMNVRRGSRNPTPNDHLTNSPGINTMTASSNNLNVQTTAL